MITGLQEVSKKSKCLTTCRLWCKALQDPAAHSLDTWDEDEAIPLNPTIPRGGLDGREEGTLVGWGFLSAMSACKLEVEKIREPITESHRQMHKLYAQMYPDSPRRTETDYITDRKLLPPMLAWLPPQLQCLKVCGQDSKVWEACATLPGLKKLVFTCYDEYVLKDLSLFFPNLEDLEVYDNRRSYNEPNWGPLFAGVESYPTHLKNVAIWSSSRLDTLPDFRGPEGCRIRVKLDLHRPEREILIHVPESNANFLHHIELFVHSPCGNYSDWKTTTLLDLAIFAECRVLSSIVLNLELFKDDANLMVGGLESLPASCTVVEMKECGGDRIDLPFVQLSPEWLVEHIFNGLRFSRIGCLGNEVPPPKFDIAGFWRYF